MSADRNAAIPEGGAERGKLRLDQWLWFARFAKSRSLAGRLCAAGAITVNGIATTKANHSARVGDVVVLPQGGWQRTVRIIALGTRRGPAVEARLLYDEIAEPSRVRDETDDWEQLLEEPDHLA